MSQFKVGDRVTVDFGWIKGPKTSGTIVRIEGCTILIEFDDILKTPEGIIFGHNGGDPSHKRKDSHCWWFNIEDDHLEYENTQQLSSLTGYQRTSEGFLTNPDNWQPGKWLI